LKLETKLKKIKLLLLDVDGVLTEGRVSYDSDGNEWKTFNVKDGLGIKLAQTNGIEIGIISGRSSAALARRAQELDIHIFFQGQSDKTVAYQQIKQERALKDENIGFIGDDLNDLKIMQSVGVRFAVNDASSEIKTIADFISEHPGGQGAVREVIETILKSQGKWDQIIRGLSGEI